MRERDRRVCPQAYENEAWNSWHLPTGPYDPYGWCASGGSYASLNSQSVYLPGDAVSARSL